MFSKHSVCDTYFRTTVCATRKFQDLKFLCDIALLRTSQLSAIHWCNIFKSLMIEELD